MTVSTGCIGCRHHSKTESAKAIGVADEDLEQILLEDEPEIVLLCRHPDKAAPSSPLRMGTVEQEPGTHCEDFEAPRRKKAISPELQKLLDRRGA